MPSIPLHLRLLSPSPPSTTTATSPLPPYLHTPTGLALLELQGKINFEFPSSLDPDPTSTISSAPNDDDLAADYIHQQTSVGVLSFHKDEFAVVGDRDGNDKGKGKGVKGKSKPVFLYVGKHQRLRGEVKTVGKAGVGWGVVRKRVREEEDVDMGDGGEERRERMGEELELVGVVRWRIVFGMRPEPVS